MTLRFPRLFPESPPTGISLHSTADSTCLSLRHLGATTNATIRRLPCAQKKP